MVKKQEIMTKVAQRYSPDARPEHVAVIIEDFFDVLAEYMCAGEAYNVPRFATFKPVQRAARTGRNPSTGECIRILPQKSIKLVISDSLKARMNKSS